MPDSFSKEQRSQIMSKIRKTNTKPELAVRKYLHTKGLRFRLYRPDLPGNPDIVLVRQRVAIFVNGCFWHAHAGCKLNRMPKSRPEYWIPKINKTAERDIKNHASLRQMGWRTVVVWECGLQKDKLEATMRQLLESIYKNTV